MNEKKLLAVDDNKETLILIEKILRRSDWKLQTAEDGESALELFDEFQPDVVTLDYTLPEMNGKEVFIELEKKRTTSSIIFLTGYTDEVVVREFLELGAFGYLTKPIRSVELLFNLSKAYDQKILKDTCAGLEEKEMDFSKLYRKVDHLANRAADKELNQRILIDRQRSYVLDDFFVFYKKNHFSMVEKINSLERMGTDEFYDIGTKLVSDIKYALEEIGSSMQDANKELLEISGRMKNIG